VPRHAPELEIWVNAPLRAYGSAWHLSASCDKSADRNLRCLMLPDEWYTAAIEENWRRLMKVLAAVFMALSLIVMSGPAAIADEIDRSDPVATAQAFLMAFKTKELATMAELVNSSNKEMFEELAVEGKTNRGYKEVFGGWRYEAALAATSVSEPLKYNRRGEGVVMFHQMEGDEVAVFVLTNEDGVWGIEDINSPSVADYDALSTTPPQ